MTALSVPAPGRESAETFVRAHLGHLVDGLVDDAVAGSGRFAGGQQAADAALAAFDVTGYARSRNEVLPPERRGASGLSPYIRHGLVQLRDVWDHVEGGPARDVRKFRDELLWQEYARHWYARFGTRSRLGIRRELPARFEPGPGWDRHMACVDEMLAELEHDGWVVNQARMWLASQWSVREGFWWPDGEDHFFRHLLDGSRAANRLGWQWTTGVGSSKPYGFGRWQVRRRAPELCGRCSRADDCPIEDRPDDPGYTAPEGADGVPGELGPDQVVCTAVPEAVWLTAESLGRSDPALAAHPDLPVIFVFDERLLARLRLAAKRLVFLTETLAELGERHDLDLRLGDPVVELQGTALAVTHAPVPGFARRAARLSPVEVHPWPWLVQPAGQRVTSFSAWRRRAAPEPT